MKVVVSGIGLITPLGQSRETTWKNILDGKCGIAKTERGWEARVIGFSVNGARSRMGDFALLAAGEAFAHAGLSMDELADKNIGCALSQSKPVVTHSSFPRRSSSAASSGGERESREETFLSRSPTKTFGDDDVVDGNDGVPKENLNAELLLSSFTGWSAGDVIRQKFKLSGPTSNVVAACATGVASIELGVYWIASGQCDMAIVGAAESSLNHFYQTGFEQMGVLAQAESVSGICPFDRKRSGFAMGEGAAALVIESEASALRRKHQPLATIESVALRQSVSDSIRFDVTGTAISRLIQFLTKNKKPQYINAHGTGTKFNDAVESRAIRTAFGNAADSISISSTKAATGHLLGAAGAVEAAFAVLALRDQIAPPTLHLVDVDDDCNLDYVPLVSRRRSLENTMSLSYGFGGQLGGVLFGKISC